MTSIALPQPNGPIKRAHLDTSVLVELSKEEALAAPVRLALRQFPFTSTSSYARKEFKQAWLKDLGWLHEIARTATGQIDIVRAINNRLRHPIQIRHVTRCLDAVVRFLDRQGGDLTDSQWAIRLRSHLAEMILSAYLELDRLVTHEFDGTQCVRAHERPTQAMNGSIDVTIPRCRATKIRCAVHGFFEVHREHFRRIAAAVDQRVEFVRAEVAEKARGRPNQLEELMRIRDTIRRADADPTHLCDIENCSKMGDALIAVDGVNDTDAFVANNDKEWRTLAEALHCELINPVIRQGRETASDRASA